MVKRNWPANAEDVRDMGLIPGLGRSPGEGHGHPLQYSFLEEPVDRGAWWVTVHGGGGGGGGRKVQTQLKRLSTEQGYSKTNKQTKKNASVDST